MRIVHVDPDDMDNPMSGGGPVRTFEIYRRLARRHDITVLTPTFEGSTPTLEREGVRYVRVGRKLGDHGSSHHITFFFTYPRVLRSLDYDLLVEDFMPPASATLTPLFTSRPIVASVQWWGAEGLSKQYRLPFFLGERYLVRLYRNFVVLTEPMRKLILSRRPGARVEVIPNGVDDSLFSLAPRFDDFILYLGRIESSEKGVDLLLRAYARIPERERLPLRLAGTGFQWDAFHKLVADLRLEAWVEFLGKVDASARARLLAACRFACVPSRVETFGMVIAEVCASGKPLVLFDRSPMNEVAPREGCAWAEPFSVESYAEAMRRMLRASVDELAGMGAQARGFVSHCRWDEVALRQEAFYEDTVAKEPRRRVS